MIYLLFAIAAFMAIITAYFVNSMSKTGKYSKFMKAIVVGISIIAFMSIAIYLLHQSSFN